MHANDTHSRDLTPRQAIVVEQAAPASRSGPGRLAGLDTVKGALVLVMVLYHWMNYFVGLDSGFYRYIRFVTPSFIFLSGFLVTHIYLPRVFAGERGIQARMVRRGLKLLGIVLILNAVARVLGTGIVVARLQGRPSDQLAWAYLTGSTPVAFSVLVPIAYLLILSAGLLFVSRYFPGIFHLVAITLSSAALFGEWAGINTGYLDMLSIGMFGASAGHMQMGTIKWITGQHTAILGAYALHLYALAVWNTILPLQFVSVSLNILVLYWIGERSAQGRPNKGMVIRLGEYSLLAYIAQIVILQLLRRGMHMAGLDGPAIYLALLACAVILAVIVELADRIRRNVPAAARIYNAIFS